MVAAWSLDRLGRSLTDLLGVLQELHAKGVHLYLHQQGLDTSTPSGRAMSQMLGVFAEFERAISGNGSWPDWRELRPNFGDERGQAAAV
jgi:DNA invertase Pin-like site-specific DNA recombinase